MPVKDGHLDHRGCRSTSPDEDHPRVKCTVVHDVGFENGTLAEDTSNAQDTAGKKTHQYLPDGTIGTEGSWQAGVNGAQPGIIIEASPKVGDKYQQESAAGVAQDAVQVVSLNKWNLPLS